MKRFLLLVVTGIVLFSCKARKAIDDTSGSDSTAITKKPVDVNKSIDADVKFFQKVLVPPKFDQLKISTKVNVETQSSYLPTLDATIYIENNKKVWMNLSAFFISMARGVATPEGIKAYNKTDKTFIDSDFDYLNGLLNTNFINYNSLQRLLLGRTFVKINDREFRLSKNAQGFKMASTVNQVIEAEDGKTSEYKIELQYAQNYDLMNVYLKDVNNSDELQVSYSDWLSYKDFRLPKNVKILIKGSKEGQILLENTKFDDSKMQTPFSVPGTYTKIEIK
ncbi:DUF4292 domain-containing protein [Marnyiella aurantia]|uniref:DUF4292 domain-containing protein n=1 Tax=Marnyiella aurantia TaxID=2758037 RepID=A0A7D7QXH2_9FLAO|nr:DUF4292 domain-containing protein [Marnyiella aurantia]MBA5246725.1 DUF4292 domain-containing protein [Marnyiella aurantia]QMS97926.1 DUF4292 domain-containing protein [Marnyiella aurantia]